MSHDEWDGKIADSCNRALRAALHKNLVEQTNCDCTTRSLDTQKKWVHSRLTREERDVRQQLQLLQLEQRQLIEPTGASMVSELESLVSGDRTTEDESSYSCSTLDQNEVVNPYPITSRSRSGSNSLQDQSTVGQTSPSIRSSRDLSEFDGSRPWPGDVEAISSIRRGLKPSCRQRLDQQNWARSRSLKERPQSSALTRLHSMFRSKSLRDPDKVRHSVSSSSEACSPSGSGTCSRSGSLKNRSNVSRKSEPFVDQELRRSVSLKSKITPREKLSDPDSCPRRETKVGALGKTLSLGNPTALDSCPRPPSSWEYSNKSQSQNLMPGIVRSNLSENSLPAKEMRNETDGKEAEKSKENTVN